METEKRTNSPQALIFIPAYNAAAFIQDAINSVLAQSYQDFTLLIINDGSTDDTLAVIENIKDPRIVVIDQENMGVSRTANTAIEFAKEHDFEYLMRLDADDIAMPNRLEVQIGLLEAAPAAVMCSSNCIYIDETGLNKIGTTTVSLSPGLIRWELLHGFRGVIQPSVTFRTDALVEAGGYRPEFPTAEDIDLFLRITDQHKAINAAETLTKIRLRSNSLSLGDNLANIQFHYYARACAKRRKKGLEEHDFHTHQENLGIAGKFYIWREVQMLKFWRKNMTTNNKIYLLLSVILDPRRLILRIVRKLDKSLMTQTILL